MLEVNNLHHPPILHGSTYAVMEKYTRNARFCLICNYVSKIIPALQSRCTKFRFAPLEGNFVRERLELVVKNEGCVHCERNIRNINNRFSKLRSCSKSLNNLVIWQGTACLFPES